MIGFKTSLAEGIARLLHDQHVGVYSTGAPYDPASSLPAITLRKVPQEPDRLIALTVYPASDAVGVPNSVVALQVRCRWGGSDPRPADDLDDAVFAILQQFSGTLETDVKIAWCQRISGTPLGQDESGRYSVSSNYHVSAYWPTSNRI